MDDIFQRAAHVGVETQYWDGLGHLHTVDPGVLSRLLEVMGENRNRRNAILPPWVVIRGNSMPAIRLAVPAGLPCRWEIISDRVMAHGQATTPDLTLPSGLPCGIFGLRVFVTQEQAQSYEEKPLIICPQQAYQGEPTTPQRMWALAAQLYGVRSLRNWGHGDFSDLIALINLAADLGACGVGLNPLHAGFDDHAQEPSPYYPSSRV